MRTTSPVVSMSTLSSNPANDWTLQIPLSDLVALQGLPGRMEQLEAENKQLRRELEALRRIQSEMMMRLSDAIRERKSG